MFKTLGRMIGGDGGTLEQIGGYTDLAGQLIGTVVSVGAAAPAAVAGTTTTAATSTGATAAATTAATTTTTAASTIGNIGMTALKGALTGAATGIGDSLLNGGDVVDAGLKGAASGAVSGAVSGTVSSIASKSATTNITGTEKIANPTTSAPTIRGNEGQAVQVQNQQTLSGHAAVAHGPMPKTSVASKIGNSIKSAVSSNKGTGTGTASTTSGKSSGSTILKAAGQYGVQGLLSVGSAIVGAKQASAANKIQQQSLEFQKKSYADEKAERDSTKAQLKADALNAYNSASLFGEQLQNSTSNMNLFGGADNGGIYSLLSSTLTTRNSTDLT